MKGVFIGALVAGVLVAAASAAQFRGTADAVRVFVTVTDNEGRLVTTLTRTDFELKDEGRVQIITQFDNTPRPIQLIIMLDVSGSMEGNLPLLRDAAQQLFTRLRKDDVAQVGTFGHNVIISPTFTNDLDRLRATLPAAIAPDAPTPLWLAVDAALDGFGEAGDKRRVILVLSDGRDNGPLHSGRRPISEAAAIDRGHREDVMIYSIGLRSRTMHLPPGVSSSIFEATLMSQLPDPGLERVAEETGGGYTEIRVGQDLGAAFARVANELHSQYLLGYSPPSRDGKAHEINVSLPGRNLTPRARKSYLAPRQ